MKHLSIICVIGVLGVSVAPVVNAADLKLNSITVKKPIKAGRKYTATIPFTSTGKFKVTRGCFFWSGEGPYCFPAKVGRTVITVKLRTGNPKKYTLSTFMEYTDRPNGRKKKRTNRVSTQIDVRP